MLANNGGVNASDALSFDIMAQAGQAVKHPAGIDPLGGLPGDRIVIASGVSQSEGFLVTYYNSVHAADPVYDAFFLYLGISRGAYGAFRLPIRSDLSTRVFKIDTENDVALLPSSRALDAALDHTVRWVASDTQPPSAPCIQLAIVPPVPPPPPVPFTPPPASVARDIDGYALGGIRLSQHSVPTATNTGVNAGPGSCILFGTHVPFDDGRMSLLYKTTARMCRKSRMRPTTT